ncbi:uncharacterized protein J4E88_010714 [Alternaria novae-zelandiae]|uniref:uncharacterized protein n=1 Tax=Alternaria novae-zelandiae TaxID=430562 RepID=UPI0020C3F7C4|nr:uncharacterized protein J4E88_010714 [Alternaria novae-zelandiae]KAI4664462.1 hypothetical protein J4E88_010714 [Alternaria novae-zelandiae]
MCYSKTITERWLSSPGRTTNNMIKDTSTLALNVISSVAFENTEVNEPTLSHQLSLRDALVTVMSTSISPAIEGIMLLFKLPILESLLPTSTKRLLLAMREFRQYMDETVVKERSKVASGQSKAATLISTLIRANDEAKSGSGVSKSKLSDVEIRGNIFIFTVGGLESTSIALSYALALLAVYPEVQDWVIEELDEVLKDEAADELEYARVFPQLKRVMAVMTMLESKKANEHIALPTNTQIMLNSWASHTSAANFPDPLTWNPKRWTQSQSAGSSKVTLPEILSSEELKHPKTGSGFFAWGAGPRICPGMKFSQVEFCSVLSSVLKKVRVEVVCRKGEKVEVVRQKVECGDFS